MAVGLSEMLAIIYEAMPHHYTEDHNLIYPTLYIFCDSNTKESTSANHTIFYTNDDK
jgi:hypothetical protein